jgi:type IV pilus assembly protein PilA
VNQSKGLTLLELLVIIAIIGVLTTLIGGSLLRARQIAQERGAQSYARSVFVAASAYIAENRDSSAGDVVRPCGDGVSYSPGGVASYTVPDPGGIVTTCEVIDAGGTTFSVSVTSINGTPFAYP